MQDERPGLQRQEQLQRQRRLQSGLNSRQQEGLLTLQNWF